MPLTAPRILLLRLLNPQPDCTRTHAQVTSTRSHSRDNQIIQPIRIHLRLVPRRTGFEAWRRESGEVDIGDCNVRHLAMSKCTTYCDGLRFGCIGCHGTTNPVSALYLTRTTSHRTAPHLTAPHRTHLHIPKSAVLNPEQQSLP